LDKKFWISTFIILNIVTLILALSLIKFSLQTTAGMIIISAVAVLLILSNLIYYKIIKNSNLINNYLEITNNLSYIILAFVFYVVTNNELLVFLFLILGFGSVLSFKKDNPKKTY
jgi:hypothetical protein